MQRTRINESDCRKIAAETGLDLATVRTIVGSYFDAIARSVSSLPFSSPTKLYSRAVFDEHNFVCNIPYLGRLGSSYSRYLRWRANASRTLVQEPREKVVGKYSPEQIEEIAQAFLSGKEIPKLEKQKNYKRVWLVGPDGKRQAKQVLIKE